MKTNPGTSLIGLSTVVILMASGCGSPAPTATRAPVVSPAASPTATSAPTATATASATPEPSPTPTPAVLPLEIVEWSEWPYAHPADPANTDTHVEALIRNPNDFAVRVDTDSDELRFVNAAGEAAYTNPNPVFHIWQGEWMLPGETAALSACVCFVSSGLEKQDWESLELVAPLEMADDIVYTPDVEIKLGEVINLAEAHLGGDGLGLETTLTNTSDQVLESMPMRVLARDASGRYVGVAFAGNAVASFTGNAGIQPGATGTGINVIEIDYVDQSVPLTYEGAAIGIPAQGAVPPPGTPAADWEGIPIMPGAIGGEDTGNGYQFTTQADIDTITDFYETALANLGYDTDLNADPNGGYTILNFHKGDTSGMVAMAPVGALIGVAIIIKR